MLRRLPAPPPSALRDLPLRHLLGSPTPDRTERDRVLAILTSKSVKRPPLTYVTVTQIVDPRQAYWEMSAPEVELSLEQVERMEAGSVLHDRFAHVVTAEPFREQRVDRDSIRGKIDIFEDHPVEVKTTGRMPDDLVRERPGYLLQLLFYCAMVKLDRGYIVVISRSSQEVRGFDSLRAWRVEVSDLSAVWREAERRRDLLIDALERGDPSRLPRCKWFGAGCSLQSACDCTAGAGQEESEMLGCATVIEDPDEARRIERLLATNGEAAWKGVRSVTDQGTPPLRLRDFPYARKRMMEHLAPSEPPEAGETGREASPAEGAGAERLKEISAGAATSGMRKRVLRALGVGWANVRRGAVDDPWVANVAGEPVKFKATRLRSPVDRTEIIRMFPDDVAEIGAAAALLGAKKGRLVLYYERAEDERERLLIYEIGVRDPGAFARAVDDIAVAWSAAWAARDASLLPPCPKWMVDKCDLAGGCPCRGPEIRG